MCTQIAYCISVNPRLPKIFPLFRKKITEHTLSIWLFSVVAFGMLGVSGCSVYLQEKPMAQNMLGPVPSPELKKLKAALKEWVYYKSIIVQQVSGEKGRDLFSAATVSNKEFEEALRQSLENMDFLATEIRNRKYDLIAELIEQDIPSGDHIKVISKVRYTLKNLLEPEDFFNFEEIIVSSYTARFFDAFNGYKRQRIAIEGSVRKNIEIFIDKLIQKILLQKMMFREPPSK